LLNKVPDMDRVDAGRNTRRIQTSRIQAAVRSRPAKLREHLPRLELALVRTPHRQRIRINYQLPVRAANVASEDFKTSPVRVRPKQRAPLTVTTRVLVPVDADDVVKFRARRLSQDSPQVNRLRCPSARVTGAKMLKYHKEARSVLVGKAKARERNITVANTARPKRRRVPNNNLVQV
jgi:hypothetical protein